MFPLAFRTRRYGIEYEYEHEYEHGHDENDASTC